jgi:hypothetical protein
MNFTSLGKTHEGKGKKDCGRGGAGIVRPSINPSTLRYVQKILM